MSISVFFLLFYIFQTFAYVDLQGNWTNELGSKVEFEQAQNGDLWGHFTSGVGDLKGLRFWLYGHVDAYNHNPTIYFGVTFSCVVYGACNSSSWTAPNPSAVWSGIVLNDTIYTTWLFTSSLSVKTYDSWTNTLVGTNIFNRN